MDREIISFIVPAYNAEVTLHRTIQSILNQTSDSYRIIIINDGSTDKTEEIGKAYSQKYPGRITYVYQPNRGLGGARNHGIELADTEYISFLDSDDWLMPHYVEHIAAQLEKNPGQKPEIIMTLPQIYDENSKLIADWYDQPLFRELFPEDGAYINPQADSRIYRTDVNQCRKILRMDFVKKVHFRFREKVNGRMYSLIFICCPIVKSAWALEVWDFIIEKEIRTRLRHHGVKTGWIYCTYMMTC